MEKTYVCCALSSILLVQYLNTQEGAGQLYSLQTTDRMTSAIVTVNMIHNIRDRDNVVTMTTTHSN